MIIRYTKLRPDAVAPTYAHGPDEDAGMDLRAVEETILEPGVPTLVKTGLAIEIPSGYEAQIRPRSGLALKHGITIPNSPATIDPGYRGEVGVILLWGGHNGNGWSCSVKEREGDGIPWWPRGTTDGKEHTPCPDCKPAFRIASGDRIAQMVISWYVKVEWHCSETLSDTVRAGGGFGSSGV